MINETTRPLYRGAQTIWYILSIVEGALLLRFVLKLLQANPAAAFTNSIYVVTDVLVYPFAAVFQNLTVDASVFEWTTVLAMLVYWLVATAIIKLFIMSKPVSVFEADRNLVE